ncbi:hypothetical protein [Corynebacterium sp. A21]|uniref:hypothetical protein n=1 Tax=Corynebacterium sp. A21 TaxID=3457318 RepID=UPI003FD310C1
MIGGGDSSVGNAPAPAEASTPMRATLTIPDELKGAAPAMPTAEVGGGDVTGEFLQNATGSQLTYISLSEDLHAGTATERFARPALSLIKLYLADYVLEHGTVDEQFDAISMVSSSSNETADVLHEKYPEAIEETAFKYGLLSTRSHERWGYSVTSTYDVVRFIAALMEKNMTHPILVAMAGADDVATDGYRQNFGTAVLPGVIGTKWGWSDDRELHSSVSFGEDFVVAAAVTGSAEDLTSLVEHQRDNLPRAE